MCLILPADRNDRAMDGRGDHRRRNREKYRTRRVIALSVLPVADRASEANRGRYTDHPKKT
jgi:hypothetical protein